MTSHTTHTTVKHYHDSNLPVIIMIHGFRGTHHGLDLMAKKLPEYHVIVPDLPGFGESTPLDGVHSLENYVRWLDDFIEGQHLKHPPVLLGHSFGSIICAAYAAKYPHNITKLILVNPIGAPALEGPRALMTRLALFYYWLGRKLPRTLAISWLKSKTVIMIMSMTMAKTRDKQLRHYIHAQHLSYFSRFYDPVSLSESFIASVSHHVKESAKDISIPTLLIAGERDDITPLQKQRELVKLFPHAQLVIIEKVGHLTHYETPDQVATAIKNFI
jgi:pimeloyl-ACP methyl ester carboxylesterase